MDISFNRSREKNRNQCLRYRFRLQTFCELGKIQNQIITKWAAIIEHPQMPTQTLCQLLFMPPMSM
jgi:hypothetical protein